MRTATGYGKVFRDWRKRKGLSQAEVAKLAGTSQMVVSAWERLTNPGWAVRHKLASIMGLHVDALVKLAEGETAAEPVEVVDAAVIPANLETPSNLDAI